jgi:hypothetical protein
MKNQTNGQLNEEFENNSLCAHTQDITSDDVLNVHHQNNRGERVFKRIKKWYGYESGREFCFEGKMQHSGTKETIHPKHTVFCLCASRRKLLFETSQKANNFIKFNAQTIFEKKGYAPIRSYYCPLCGGWHVTSQPDDGHVHKCLIEIYADKLYQNSRKKFENIQRVHREQNMIQGIKKTFTDQLTKIDICISHQNFAKAKKILMTLSSAIYDSTLERPFINKLRRRLENAVHCYERQSGTLFVVEENDHAIF